jgi:hypothetical protein
MQKTVTLGGGVLAVIVAGFIGTVLILAQALVRLVARRR